MTTACRRAAILTTVLLAAGALTASATTIHVPEDYATVLAGVDAAFPGDSVLVGPGTWTTLATRVVVVYGVPHVVTACAFPRGGVTILGTGGRDVTILDASVEGPGPGAFCVIAFAERLGEGPLTMEGFSVTGARGPWGAQALPATNSDGVIVRSCRFFGNESNVLQGASAGAAIAGVDCDVEVVDSIVDHNLARAGVFWILDSSLTIRTCLFEENAEKCVQVDTDAAPSPSVLIEDSEFVRNRGRGDGVGIDLSPSQNFTIQRCRFVENVAEENGGGAIRVDGSFGRIDHCLFERDSCLASNTAAAGIYWVNTWGYVENNTFVGCHASNDGAAFVAVGTFGGVGFANNLVTHSAGGAAVSAAGAIGIGPATQCNDYWANSGGNLGNWPVIATDFFLDPLFCDPGLSDYTVREDSPCAVGGACGQVGALGVGCESLAVEPTSWSKVKSAYRGTAP